MVAGVTTLPPFITGGQGAVARTQTNASDAAGTRPSPAANDTREAPSGANPTLLAQARLRDVIDARQSLDLSIGAAQSAIEIVREASTLAERASDPNLPDEARALQQGAFAALMQKLSETIARAVEAGARPLAGEALVLDGDPPAVLDEGLDLRFKDSAADGAPLRVSRLDTIGDAHSAAQTVRLLQQSDARIQAGLERLRALDGKLDHHGELLSLAESARVSGVRTDLDAEGARYLALQVKQELAGLPFGIANAAPQSILTLFRE
jgi:hypothetical protein